MTGRELAKEMGIDYSVLSSTLDDYTAQAERNAKTGEPDEYVHILKNLTYLIGLIYFYLIHL